MVGAISLLIESKLLLSILPTVPGLDSSRSGLEQVASVPRVTLDIELAGYRAFDHLMLGDGRFQDLIEQARQFSVKDRQSLF